MKVGLINEYTHYSRTLGLHTKKDFEEKTNTIIESVNKHNLDILLAPEWYYLKCPFFTKEEKDWTLEKIISNTPKETLILPGTFVWIYKEIKRAFRKTQLNFYNTAPIINNNRLQEYHKSRLNRESGEFGIADESKDQYKIFKPTAGVENGKIFNWRNLEIGLEICIDYGKGCLSSKNIHYLDLQLVIACGIPFYKENTAIKDKGYLIICDGHQGKYETERFDNRIYQRKEDNFNKIQPIQYTKHLDLYEI